MPLGENSGGLTPILFWRRDVLSWRGATGPRFLGKGRGGVAPAHPPNYTQATSFDRNRLYSMAVTCPAGFTASDDVSVMNFALIFERLGVAFYGLDNPKYLGGKSFSPTTPHPQGRAARVALPCFQNYGLPDAADDLPPPGR